MAERRMFAKTIIDSDAFLDMPATAQLLYFHLSMRADDDGFINKPKSIMRSIGANEDDMKLLFAKKFVIPFDTGVVVIKHWRINNYIRKDMYHMTNYKDELAMLEFDENGAYSLSVTETLRLCNDVVPSFSEHTSTQDRLGKDRLGKDRLGKDSLGKDRLGKDKKAKKSPACYFPNDELLDNAFKDFVEMRKKLKAPLTNRAVELAIKKLEKLSTGSDGIMDNNLAIDIVNNSVMNGWKSFYPLDKKDKKTQGSGYDWENL